MVVWCFYIQKRYDGKPKWLFYTLISILTLSCLGAIIANGFTNILFTIDKTENTYIRGPFIVAYSSAFSLFVLAPIATIIFNRKNIVKNEMFSFLVATISPIIGAIIQLLLPPMVSVIYPTVTFGVLVVFVYFSKTELQVDYLTGVNNRKQLTLTANQIIGKAHRKQYLVGVMVDINKFKVINDTYGHSEGDEALILASRLLSESTKKGEFLARYGGDEFVIPYEDDTLDEVDELKKRINNKTTNFNISKTKPYQINFSIGSMVFSKDEELDVDKFIQEIDKKMYENKRS
jgi:diguanylate cyclase (GGDEF)-like protein